MRVLKFGGTSVGSVQSIEQLKNIVWDTQNKQNEALIIVVSAMGGITDALILAAKFAEKGNEQYKTDLKNIYNRHIKAAEVLLQKAPQLLAQFQEFLTPKTNNLENLLNGVFLIQELSARTLDCVSAYGEAVSSVLVSLYFQQFTDKKTYFINSIETIKTDASFGGAKVDFETTNANLQKATQHATPQTVYVMGGFIGSTAQGVVTTLGRGGSDYTAAIVGAAISASEIEIWTDVDGVMTADPRKVKKAFSIAHMTYEEALEMSHFGAKVLHPPTVQPALNAQIPISIKNTFNPNFAGTFIHFQEAKTTRNLPVKGISSIAEVALLSVSGSGMIGVTGIASRLFGALAAAHINIILITQASSEHSICFAVKPPDALPAEQAIHKAFSLEIQANIIEKVKIETQLSVVAVIGSNMKNTVGVSGNLFSALGKNGVNVRAIAQGSSELNISVVIDKTHENKALNALHEAFFLSDTKQIPLFVVGATGLIGSTLLSQIAEHLPHLKTHKQLEIKIIGLANTQKMLIDEQGINPTLFSQAQWTQNAQVSDIHFFIQKMYELNLPNCIFVDCTANDIVVPFYPTILKNNIAIVTPNKTANSGSYQQYLDLKNTAQLHKTKFLYETNVGAGLPVINTLNNLIQSGDQLIKIEAVLSGSLSYIFNNFSTQKSFYDCVQAAQQKGYTEPDPRIDLSGKDVARKVLILTRESGQQIEFENIKIQNILPQACIEANTIADFFEALQQNENHFQAMLHNAQTQNGVLRFLATITKQNATIELKIVDAQNPFYSLSGSDNMIVFTTERYKERPLVIRGPGAGAEVTAAGVFADIISIAN